MKLTKEQLEYELVTRYFELRDGVLWRKECVGKDGRVYPARPAEGYDNGHGYLQIRAGGKKFLVHRIIFILTHNRPIREGYDIHHIYNNKTDNRIEHLEEMSHRENLQNKQVHLGGKLVGNTETKWGWKAYIRVNGKLHHLGYFKTKEEAYQIYLLACKEVEMYGKLIRTNAERKAA
jgi:hypothetical protein